MYNHITVALFNLSCRTQAPVTAATAEAVTANAAAAGGYSKDMTKINIDYYSYSETPPM